MLEKIKQLLQDDTFFMSLLLVGIGISSFVLGRQSILSNISPPSARVKLLASSTTFITKTAQSYPNHSDKYSTTTPVTAKFVASRTGTKYHLITCPGTNQIKKSNRIYFATVTAAKAAGYTPALNCPSI